MQLCKVCLHKLDETVASIGRIDATTPVSTDLLREPPEPHRRCPLDEME